MGTSVSAPQQPSQPQIKNPDTIVLPSLPGVRRDGTSTDADYFNDVKWCRFVRNRPRKIGGYQEVADSFRGPIHGSLVWTGQFSDLFYSFSARGVDYGNISEVGWGGTGSDLTAFSGYTYSPNTLWSYGTLFDEAAGGNVTLLIATPMQTMSNMNDNTLQSVYTTNIDSPTNMAPVSDVNAKSSGGLFVTQPYVVLLGSSGNVTWSNANEPKNYTTGDAGSDRVTGCKIVKGLPMRTGISSGGILWSLDSVIRMDWVGGVAIFKFSHLSTQSSILSQRGVIEYDGKWYWVGIDRFFTCNGVQVEELPNDMNLHWFFENLNFSQRQKVFAMRFPKFGEIWWMFPSGDSIECDRAVIYNLRLKTWYDVEIPRSSGCTSSTFRYPIMTDSRPNGKFRASLSFSGTWPGWPAPPFVVGDEVICSSSGSICAIAMIITNSFSQVVAHVLVTNGINPIDGEGFAKSDDPATNGSIVAEPEYSVFIHEKGYDAVGLESASAIASSFTTCDFGLPTGGAQQNSVSGQDLNTRVTRIEPDFVMSGDMTVQMLGRKFAQSPEILSKEYTFSGDTGKIDLREQAREFRLKFESNVLGGFFEGGKTLVHTEPGDTRP